MLLYLRLSEKASTPHLDRQYPPPVRDSLPRILATFTTLPWAFFTSGRNWRVTSITPIRFTSKTFLKSSNCIHSGGPMGVDLPALLTSPHRPVEDRDKVVTVRYVLQQLSHSHLYSCLFISERLHVIFLQSETMMILCFIAGCSYRNFSISRNLFCLTNI